MPKLRVAKTFQQFVVEKVIANLIIYCRESRDDGTSLRDLREYNQVFNKSKCVGEL